MAATQSVAQHSHLHNAAWGDTPEPHPHPLQQIRPRRGVVTLFGYGIQARVDRGHLVLEDGIGAERCRARFPRIGHGLERLVVIGSDGYVSLSALRWLADQGACFVMLERDGSVLATTGPVRPSDARLRRAQALAGHSGAALHISRELVRNKIEGQALVAREKLQSPETAEAITKQGGILAAAKTIDAVRLIESRAAHAYWSAWTQLPISFPKNDLNRIPDHWKRFGARNSPLTGGSRLAVNPVNAILNYLYALLEAEARLAAAAMGLDPGLGMLHLDTPNRDSLACDLMEPVRPQVDAYVLDWVSRQLLRRDWFFEQRNGNCRLMADLARQLTETIPAWRRTVAPWAEWVAKTLWNGRPGNSREASPATRLTQAHKRKVRGSPIPSTPKLPSRPKPICQTCGAPLKSGKSHCVKCAPAIWKETLTALAVAGRVAAQSEEAQVRRAETRRLNAKAIAAWSESVRGQKVMNEEEYRRDIMPALIRVGPSAIAKALGVSGAYASDIRRGKRIPHPRHWGRLAALAQAQVPTSSESNNMW